LGKVVQEQSDAWYATVEHYRAWLIADGGFFRDFEADGRRYSVDLVRRMARHYLVARTIKAVDRKEDEKAGIDHDRDRHRQIVANHLNALMKDWPGTMGEQAQKVIETAESIKKEIGGGVPPYSAVSKFIWFACPKDWTLFDRFACAGMLPNGGTSVQRIEAFYAELSAPLPLLTARLRPICEESGFGLHPERIVDIMLMLRGSEFLRSSFAQDVKRSCDHFMAQLPPVIREPLDACARSVQNVMGENPMPRLAAKKWPKSG
jgi:hypothetical protein